MRGLRRAEVGGLRAWQVDVLALEAPPGPYRSCNGLQPRCWALLRSLQADSDHTTGPWVNMASRYTFVDVGSGRVLAVWSWAFDNRWETVEAADELIRRMEIRSRVTRTPAAP